MLLGLDEINTPSIVILGGARDYHAIDWYRSVKKSFPERKVILLTDSVDGEGFDKIVLDDDRIESLFIIDKLLFRRSSSLSNKWRNILKLIVLPVQVIKLRLFVREYNNCIIHAHPMYYIFLCWVARVPCGVTPQGSEILVRPNRSKIYKYFLVKLLKAASFVTVDSRSMKNAVFKLSHVNSLIVQNGVDIFAINKCVENTKTRCRICSIRGIAPLYRIDSVLDSRNASSPHLNITFVYPFSELDYCSKIKHKFKKDDEVIGRLGKDDLYKILSETFLTISIPESDSSPRSVYEAIFAGSCVAVTENMYIDSLPKCMQSRLIVVDIHNPSWFSEAVNFAKKNMRTRYIASNEAIEEFDQYRSIKKAGETIYNNV